MLHNICFLTLTHFQSSLSKSNYTHYIHSDNGDWRVKLDTDIDIEEIDNHILKIDIIF